MQNNEDLKIFIQALLNDMKTNSTKAKGHHPHTEMDIVISVSLDYAQNYIKEFARINNINI